MVHKIVMEDGMGFDDSMQDNKRPRMILNPKKEVVLKIIDRIYKCEGKCPCQPITEKDTRCPCSDFTENGTCHCHLFIPEEEK